MCWDKRMYRLVEIGKIAKVGTSLEKGLHFRAYNHITMI